MSRSGGIIDRKQRCPMGNDVTKDDVPEVCLEETYILQFKISDEYTHSIKV